MRPPARVLSPNPPFPGSQAPSWPALSRWQTRMSHVQPPSIPHWSNPSTSEMLSVESYMVRVHRNQGSIIFSLTHLEAGMEIVTFFAAVYCIFHRPSGYRKGQRFYVIYGGILLSLTTITHALDVLWGQYMWI